MATVCSSSLPPQEAGGESWAFNELFIQSQRTNTCHQTFHGYTKAMVAVWLAIWTPCPLHTSPETKGKSSLLVFDVSFVWKCFYSSMSSARQQRALTWIQPGHLDIHLVMRMKQSVFIKLEKSKQSLNLSFRVMSSGGQWVSNTAE